MLRQLLCLSSALFYPRECSTFPRTPKASKMLLPYPVCSRGVPAMPLPELHGNEILAWHRWVREQLDFFPRKPTKN